VGLLLGRVKPPIPPVGSNPRGEAKLGGWLLEKSTGSVCTFPCIKVVDYKYEQPVQREVEKYLLM